MKGSISKFYVLFGIIFDFSFLVCEIYVRYSYGWFVLKKIFKNCVIKVIVSMLC